MNLNDQFMQNAIVRINELQADMKNQAKSIEGAEEYVQAQMKLYAQSEDMRTKLNAIEEEAQRTAENFFANNRDMLESMQKAHNDTLHKKDED